MALGIRTVPTHLHAVDKLVDLGLLSLSATQALNLVAGGLIAFELLVDAPALPLLLRQVVAALAVALGLLGAFCHVDGKSLWSWLLVGLRYARFPRRAVWRPAPLPRTTASPARWHEVTPRLAWPDRLDP